MKEGQTIGQWLKWDFETNGFLEIRNKDNEIIYAESLDRFWAKWERDSEGKVIYYEDSKGEIEDNRPKPCENKVVEIEGVKYKLTKV